MNTRRKGSALWAVAAIALIGLATATAPAIADSDEHEYEEHSGYRHSQESSGSGAALHKSSLGGFDPLYIEECGSCHVPYPPAALPERSWRKLMGGLADHFGDNAELDAQTRARLTDYLVGARHNARRSDVTELSKRIKRDETPIRITELRRFKKEHDEVPSRAFRKNPDLMLSQCDSCHTKAAQGSYRERDINIPGIGAWED